MNPRRDRKGCGCGCTPILALTLVLGIFSLVYFIAPIRTNILILGLDYTLPDNFVARSDTIIMTTIIPFEPYIGLLSMPRDLWVNIPDVGENRINTAHFFAEAQQAGTGTRAVIQTIQVNFDVEMDYYVRIRFEGFREIVNAMGGVDIYLTEPTAGYEAGAHHLTGNKALAFARHRLGSDDFFRMQQSQILAKAILGQMLQPDHWVRLPAFLSAVSASLETNMPLWQWPRLGLALVRAGPDGLDSRMITREMVTQTVTNEGASVLLPDFPKIDLVLSEMFGE